MFRSRGVNIWDHEMPIRFGGIPLWRMTVIRLTNGGLVVHSPTRLDFASQEEFQRLGPIVAIIAPSWWHDLYLREYLSAYPNAKLYGAPTLVLSKKDAWITRTMGSLVIGPFPGCRFARLYRPALLDRRACACRWSGYLIGTSIRSSLDTVPSSRATGKKSFARRFDGSLLLLPTRHVVNKWSPVPDFRLRPIRNARIRAT